jgi:hypothetical protein
MSDAWQLAESFERTRNLLSAVNTLSIHTKLLLNGRDDSRRVAAANDARKVIKLFLERLQSELPEFERDANSAVTGAPRRANELSRRFALARSQTPAVSPLFSLSVPEFARLLDSNDEEDRRTLVEGLATLRDLLEKHHHADSTGMLGDL